MTHELKSALEELVADGPPDLVPHELARAAWLQGRRRRHLRQGLVAAVVLVLVGVGLVGVLPVVSHVHVFAPAVGGGSGSGAVGGYPERIGQQAWVRDLPPRPGPMALLMERVIHHSTYDQPAGWEAVSESGQRWHIPGIFDGNDDRPSLSPNGEDLAYLTGPNGPYVIHDLVSGDVTTYPSVGSAISSGTTRYSTEGQWPAFWSPDGRHLVLAGFPRNSDPGRALVLGLDGSVQLAQGRGFPVGWLDDQTVVWLTPSTYSSNKPVPFTIRYTTTTGVVERSIPLSSRIRPDEISQWSGLVSPDATTILILRGIDNLAVESFSLADGRSLGPARPLDDLVDTCSPAWSNSGPVVPILGDDNAYPATLSATGVRRLVAIEPSLGPECIVWAADALAGTRHTMLFGVSMNPWTWWWREIGFGILVAASVFWLLGRWILVHRRRKI